MENTTDHLEAGRKRSYYIGYFLQSGGLGGAIVWVWYVGDMNRHGEALNRGKYRFITKGYRRKGKEEFGRDLKIWGSRENTEGGGETDGEDIHRQDTYYSILVDVPLAYIRSMNATWNRLRGWEADNTPVVETDSGIHATTVCIRKDVGIRKEVEATGIWNAWQEGGIDGLGYSYHSNSILVRWWGTPRWEDDTVRRWKGRCRWIGQDPESILEGSRTARRLGAAGQDI